METLFLSLQSLVPTQTAVSLGNEKQAPVVCSSPSCEADDLTTTSIQCDHTLCICPSCWTLFSSTFTAENNRRRCYEPSWFIWNKMKTLFLHPNLWNSCFFSFSSCRRQNIQCNVEKACSVDTLDFYI
jgi:hypothetical protein